MWEEKLKRKSENSVIFEKIIRQIMKWKKELKKKLFNTKKIAATCALSKKIALLVLIFFLI